MNFELSARRYDEVVPYLKQACPSFATSPEYALASSHDDLPGVILAAFGCFLARLVTEGRAHEAARNCGAVNAIYEWDDAETRTSLRDEFLEVLSGDDELIRFFRPLLANGLAEALES